MPTRWNALLRLRQRVFVKPKTEALDNSVDVSSPCASKATSRNSSPQHATGKHADDRT